MKLIWLRYIAIFTVMITTIAAGVAITKSNMLVVLLPAMEINRYLAPMIVKGDRRFVGLLAWFGCLVSLAGLYYLMDLLLFPHSARAAFRVRDAAVISLLGMTLWFLFYWLDAVSPIKSHKHHSAKTNL